MPNHNQNVGFIDRLVRGLLAIDLLALCLTSFITGLTVILSLLLVVYLAYSGAAGFCAIYAALGRDSRQRTEP
ncbi:YgaP family membrane protein [Fibrella arboris]|uniref:YgaP family membrane protein n=1 Tax=Fibrella arboris TaxID=3242486 RepID=UPI003520E61E